MEIDWRRFPRGWFVVAESKELEVGAVRPLRYFGKDLVAYRGEDGAIRVLDAHCPHLGAHLGVGGKVVGNTIACPFHAWRFHGDGMCAEIPYANKIPKNARTNAWRVSERNGLVFLYHDLEGREPDFEIPVIEEHGSPEWTPWRLNILRVKTHPREIMENVVDRAHFPIVHHTEVETFDNVFDGHLAIQRTKATAYPRTGGVDKFSLTATYYGPGYQITEMDSFLKNRLLLAHTPVDADYLDLRFGVSLKLAGSSAKTETYVGMYIDNLTKGFHEDIQIWEHKVYREQPALCDGDGPIGRLRRWYAQFYA